MPTFVVNSDPKPKIFNHPVRLICFYLPQFHPIKENDNWWGKGFTEWTNVVRARPYMYGHRQPHLPTELGFYDLRVVDTLHRQATLAQNFGIGGFCFYSYWFDGYKLLNEPIDLWFNKGPNFPYCLCWANENWSRRWDGSDAEILMSQNYKEGFEDKYIYDVAHFFKNSRYIRVHGAPLLAIYRASELPNPIASANRFKRAAEKYGIGKIHLSMIQSFGLNDPRTYGFDSAIEFSPPHTKRLLLDPSNMGGVYTDFSGYIEDYVGVACQSINAKPTDFIRYRGCFPSWDNVARRGRFGHLFVNDSPKAYATWLKFLVHEAMVRKEHVEPLIFINAWNEWAEGAHLEPDEHYGRTFLELTNLSLQYGVAEYICGQTREDLKRDFIHKVSRLPSR